MTWRYLQIDIIRDISNSIEDISNWIAYISNWIGDISNSIRDISNYGLNVKTAPHMSTPLATSASCSVCDSAVACEDDSRK